MSTTETVKSSEREETSQLEENARNYPYSALNQFLLLCRYYHTAHPDFDKQLKKTALYFPKARWLQYQLSQLERSEQLDGEDHIGSAKEPPRQFASVSEEQLKSLKEFDMRSPDPALNGHGHTTEDHDVSPDVSQDQTHPQQDFGSQESRDSGDSVLDQDFSPSKEESAPEHGIEEQNEDGKHNEEIESSSEEVKVTDNERGNIVEEWEVANEIETHEVELSQEDTEGVENTSDSGEIDPRFVEESSTGTDSNFASGGFDGDEKNNDTGKFSQENYSLPIPGIREVAGSPDGLAFEPLHTVDYFASQGITLTDEAISNDKLGAQMKSFTEWLKSMKKLHPEQMKPQPSLAEDIIQSAAEDSNIDSEVLTEAMAEVLIKQHKTDKAIEMYNKLSLINPSKSAYFAAKIEKIKSD